MKEKYLIYKHDVCQVEEIKEKYINDVDYYVLTPINDLSLKIKVPVTSKFIRKLITKQELDRIISTISSIEIINADTRVLETCYKDLILSGTHEDLIKIIKTAYLRNKERIEKNKKTTDKDNYYFNLAESYLYNEFSLVLGLSYEETKQYIINNVK